MQHITSDVKSKGIVVAQVEIDIPENLTEAIDLLGGENAVLKLAVSQHKINEMDAARRAVTIKTAVPKTLRTALSSLDESQLDQAVTLGILTQEQADMLKTDKN